jgi:hypothetical protein
MIFLTVKRILLFQQYMVISIQYQEFFFRY